MPALATLRPLIASFSHGYIRPASSSSDAITVSALDLIGSPKVIHKSRDVCDSSTSLWSMAGLKKPQIVSLPTQKYIPTKTAASLLNIAPKTLYNSHSRGASWAPPRYKIGRRVVYKLEEVLACIRPA